MPTFSIDVSGHAEISSASTFAPCCQLPADGGVGVLMRGYLLRDAIQEYIAHLTLNAMNTKHWITQKETILTSFRVWASSQGALCIEQLKPYHLSDYQREKAKELGFKPSTLNRHAVVIRSMTRWALNEGRVQHCELARQKIIAPSYRLPEIPTFDHFEKLLEQEHDQEMRDVMTALLYTGLRRGELFAIRWRDVCEEEGYIYIRSTATWTTKNKRDRTVPVCKELKLLLKRRRKIQDLKGPFQQEDGHPTVIPNYVSKAFRALAGVRMHSLRHAFCTHVLQDLKADPLSLQAVIGHTTLRTTQLYLHPSPDTPRRIADLLDKSRPKEKPLRRGGANTRKEIKKPSA